MLTEHYYFAYGSNMNPARVDKRRMKYQTYHGGLLRDYQLAFNKRSVIHPGAASANVVEAPGNAVEGVLYRLTDASEIEIMDPFEGFPLRYARTRLAVECESGSVSAWVYIANEAYIASGLKPTRWYLEHLLCGKPFLSTEYFESLATTDCLPDSDIEPR